MRKIRKLKHSKKQDFENDFFVFDVETYGLNPTVDHLAFGVIYGNNFIKVLRSAEEFKKEFKRDIYRNKKIFAHNAEYDCSSIFGNVIENIDNKAIFNGKFISVKYGNTVFVDSLNVFPVSVDKIGDMMGFKKGVTPYKFINPKAYNKDDLKIEKRDIEYCIKDCKIVFDALLQMFKRVGGVRITIASTAMYYFRKFYLENDLLYSPLNDEFFDSYYGGRTEAFIIGKTKSRVYDINSLYPDRMLNIDFPDYSNLKKDYDLKISYFNRLLKFKEGYAKVRILHDKSYFGLLPYKCDKTKKLLFPVGEFTTTVNFNELRFAVNTGKVKILKVYHAVYGNPIESPFIDYVNDLYNERKETNNDILKLILKLLLNSLYGKFGMREKYQTTYYKNIPHGLISKLREKGEYLKVQYFSKDRNDCYLVTENKKMKETFFSIPSIASYITSAARIKLADGLLKCENLKVTYCDTDSIFLEDWRKPPLNISNELGDWKLEDKFITEVRGLKNYSYYEERTKPNLLYPIVIKDAIKGVSKRAIKLERFKFQTTKYVKTKEAIRRNLQTGSQHTVTKSITNKYDKRIILKNGNTKPIEL